MRRYANEEGDKYADDADRAGQKVDLKTRTTVRNLRCAGSASSAKTACPPGGEPA